jgi:hypothetical protein
MSGVLLSLPKRGLKRQAPRKPRSAEVILSCHMKVIRAAQDMLNSISATKILLPCTLEEVGGWALLFDVADDVSGNFTLSTRF